MRLFSLLRQRLCRLTAAAQGICYSSAQALAAAGARVVATDMDLTKLATLGESGIEICGMDVRDGASVDSAVVHIGQVDILFNCAGTVHHGTVLACTD